MNNSVSLGEYAKKVIGLQFQHIVEQEKGVLEDSDPEFLHQMRVGSRRLATALEVFDKAVLLPKPARRKSVTGLAKSLGKLRDLDVQLLTLKEEYIPQLNSGEQHTTNCLFEHLKEKRSHAFLAVKRILADARYLELKSAYTRWLRQPGYTQLGEIDLELILPDLLSPLLSRLLLHPAWLISQDDTSRSGALTLHSLRKTAKSVRYQAEYFADFYESDFKEWISQLKILQDTLGKVQDTFVLRKQLSTHFSNASQEVGFVELENAIQGGYEKALSKWNEIRQQYLEPDFRHHLRCMLIMPKSRPDRTNPSTS